MATTQTSRLEGIRAIVFDAYGTLFDVNSAVDKLAAEIGPNAKQLSLLWRQKQLEYTWLRSLMGTHADFWTVTRDALNFAMAELALADPGLADELMTLYLKLDMFADTAGALNALRARGCRLAILSNGSPSMLDSVVRHAGLDKVFEHVLSVEEVGIYKPSRRVYRLAMQKFHLQDAPSICFVSANSWDAQAAAQFGFQVGLLSRGPRNLDQLPGKPARTIASLLELSQLI